MSQSSQEALLSLSLSSGLGPVSIRNLVSRFSSPEKVLHATKGKLLSTPGIGHKAAEAVLSLNGRVQALEEIEWCEKHQVNIISYLDPGYPNLLRYIHHAPLFLFQKGELDLNAQPAIAIVGTRNATEYGKELAAEFASFFALRGINIVSGLAYGIDIAAHKAAIESDGISTCVLAHGLDTIYPSVHKRKAKAMLQKGAWLTEYLTNTKPDAPHFPARNRIVAGMCQAVVVIEAGASGGALITARQAFDSNRQVFAIPGRVNDQYSQGCHQLISENTARLITSPEEVLEELEIQWFPEESLAHKTPVVPLSTEESDIINALASNTMILDQLIHKTGVSASQLQSRLLAMEFKGLITQLPGKRFKVT